jgi:hypothetical protein
MLAAVGLILLISICSPCASIQGPSSKFETRSSSTETTLSLEWFPDDYDPLAVCNDGTRGGYYFKEAIDSTMKNIYVIFLPGGGQCYDEASCQDRWDSIGSTFMSSRGFTPTIEEGGLLDSSPQNSPFWAANKAVLSYCTSDGYMGDVAASNATWNWHFRGQRTVYSMIRHLREYHGLSSTSQILLGGASAGGRGMMTLAESLYWDHLPIGSEVTLFLDSPYYIDIQPYSSAFEGFYYQEQQKYRYYNTTAIIPKLCSWNYNPTYQIDDHEMDWKCQFGEYRMPFVFHIPYLLIASQYDEYQLQHNTQGNPPYPGLDHDAIINYTINFAAHTKASLFNLATNLTSIQSSKHRRAYFSWACYNHAVSETLAFSTLTTEMGVSQKDALEAFLATNPFIPVIGKDRANDLSKILRDIDASSIIQQDGKNLMWFDQCEGFACGSGCAA